jgi:di/tricarboxylate transporter
MTAEQAIVFAILAGAMALFVWGRWRYDIVALLALLAAVYAGAVPAASAFAGFGHPAVITVAAVLVISRALQVSGLVDHLVRLMAPTRKTLFRQVAASCGLATLLSAFMNNVGALALMLPVTVRNAYRAGSSPSQVLMPLSFATLLGGLVTMIGTPPNIVIATFRKETEGAPFGMFDFTPVGLTVAVAGFLYVVLIGRHLVPAQRQGDDEAQHLFRIEAYVTEAEVPEGSALIGRQIRDIERLCQNEATVMAIIRGRRRLLAPGGLERLLADDVLALEGDPTALEPLFDSGGLRPVSGESVSRKDLRSPEVRLVEAVVMPNSPLEGRAMRGLRMHDRYGVNLLAAARPGAPPQARLGGFRFRTGDVLLLQGERNTLQQVQTTLRCIPLADRGLQLPARQRVLLPLAIFAAAIAASAGGLIPVQIAFMTAVAALVLCRTLTLREVYEAVEWPVVLLLGALIPVGQALEATGGTGLIAGAVVALAGALPVWAVLALVIAVCMVLSDLIHNTPTAVLMAPIGVGIAQQLGLAPDAFLMAVAVGAASPYLTPIGHQSNTLVMGPGGYRFGDYARMGAPLDILILAVAVPMIMLVWLP